MLSSKICYQLKISNDHWGEKCLKSRDYFILNAQANAHALTFDTFINIFFFD